MKEKLKQLALQCGMCEVGCIEVNTLEYYPEIREICKGNACGKYGTSWACPPGVGSLEECRVRCEKYETMLLFTKKYDLEDSFDFEGMMEGKDDFKNQVNIFDKKVKDILSDYFLFSNEGCEKCEKCTYPDVPCRFPKQLHPSLEGYGFNVSELAKNAEIKYHNGMNTVTYFGALLF